MTYDQNNIFAKILRGELPCNKVYEDDNVLAFHNIHPQRRIHVLIIPKTAYCDVRDFGTKASESDIVALIRSIPKVADALGIKESGFRIIANTDGDGCNEIPHMHFHMLGGEPAGALVA